MYSSILQMAAISPCQVAQSELVPAAFFVAVVVDLVMIQFASAGSHVRQVQHPPTPTSDECTPG